MVLTRLGNINEPCIIPNYDWCTIRFPKTKKLIHRTLVRKVNLNVITYIETKIIASPCLSVSIVFHAITEHIYGSIWFDLTATFRRNICSSKTYIFWIKTGTKSVKNWFTKQLRRLTLCQFNKYWDEKKLLLENIYNFVSLAH